MQDFNSSRLSSPYFSTIWSLSRVNWSRIFVMMIGTRCDIVKKAYELKNIIPFSIDPNKSQIKVKKFLFLLFVVSCQLFVYRRLLVYKLILGEVNWVIHVDNFEKKSLRKKLEKSSNLNSPKSLNSLSTLWLHSLFFDSFAVFVQSSS